jgi:hypothetical protein
VIYFIQAEGIGHIKIGFTDGTDADSRLATLQTGSPVPLRVLHTMPGTMEDEKNLHRRFASASAGGEWFKAIPELLAMIPEKQGRSCDGVEIAERSVTIRVLTVGRKQFAKSLLNQLPERTCIDWRSAVGRALARLGRGRNADISKHSDLATAGIGDVWGWVVGDYYPHNSTVPWGKYRWIIFQAEEQLFKQKDFDRPPVEEFGDDKLAAGALPWLYQTRFALPGWGHQDQLFIGV